MTDEPDTIEQMARAYAKRVRTSEAAGEMLEALRQSTAAMSSAMHSTGGKEAAAIALQVGINRALIHHIDEGN